MKRPIIAPHSTGCLLAALVMGPWTSRMLGKSAATELSRRPYQFAEKYSHSQNSIQSSQNCSDCRAQRRGNFCLLLAGEERGERWKGTCQNCGMPSDWGTVVGKEKGVGQRIHHQHGANSAGGGMWAQAWGLPNSTLLPNPWHWKNSLPKRLWR